MGQQNYDGEVLKIEIKNLDKTMITYHINE